MLINLGQASSVECRRISYQFNPAIVEFGGWGTGSVTKFIISKFINTKFIRSNFYITKFIRNNV